MKIGIITHHYIKNYGAFLQAYALQQVVSELYPDDDVEIINYINKKHYFVNLRPLILRRPQASDFKGTVRLFFEDKRKLIGFYQAKKKLKLSARCRSAKAINKKKYDVIIIGSDEVWNYSAVGADELKFGVGLVCGKMISYAPSAGSVKESDLVPDYIREGIEHFDAVSVRDKQTQQLIQPFYRRNITDVLDPTLLYDFEKEYQDHNEVLNMKPYILVYQCVLNQDQIDEIKDFAQARGLLIIGAGDYETWFDKAAISISPFEWVQLFNHAKYILTGTFHGTVFAIKAKAQFVSYPTFINRLDKIASLLNQLNLENRLLREEDNADICNRLEIPIDYQKVHGELEALRSNSINFLKTNIK